MTLIMQPNLAYVRLGLGTDTPSPIEVQMFANCFLSSVLFMLVGTVAVLATGRPADWQWGSGIGFVSGCGAAVLLTLCIRLAEKSVAHRRLGRRAEASTQTLTYSSD